MAYFDFEDDPNLGLAWKPAVDVYERAGEFVVRVELPGVARDRIRLDWRNGVLTIAGSKRRGPGSADSRYICMERQYGLFRRDIAFRSPIDFEGAQADLEDGLLSVRLPKLAKRRGRSSIPIA